MAIKKKDESIESLRGVAIIFLVIGHVMGIDTGTGLRVPDGSNWRYFFNLYAFLIIPLWTAISGYVYAFKHVQKDKVKGFISGKARRILIPLISVGSIQYILNAIAPGVNNSVPILGIWKVYLFPYAQFWFLQSLFLIFMLMIVLDLKQITMKFNTWLISLIISILLEWYVLENIEWEFFSIIYAIYILPFFLLGIGLNNFSDKLFSRKFLIPVALIYVGMIAVRQMTWFKVIDLSGIGYEYPNPKTILNVLYGLAGTWIIFYIRFSVKLLTLIGFFSYSIYLFHVIGAAGSRFIAGWFGFDDIGFLLLIGVIFGIGFAIVAEIIIKKSKILSRIFYGI